MSGSAVVLAVAFLAGRVSADTYCMNPRCSNNRLNEKSANRANANRLFDSQNNNRGGYNVGDNGENAFDQNGGGDSSDDIFDKMYNPNRDEEDEQYNMMYMEGSVMRMTWTSQHGCGNSKNNCNHVIQWGCDTHDYLEFENNFNGLKTVDTGTIATGTRMILRNGGTTNTPDDPNNANDIANKFQNNNNGQVKGRHESEEYYYFAKKRERNKGLFTADQNIKGNTQIYTRQNPNGNRRGLEVPEERDYYPWTGPSPWRDLAWLGNDVEYCNEVIKPATKELKYSCVDKNGNQPELNDLPTEDQIAATTEDECTDADGIWYGTDPAARNVGELDCQRAEWSQVNNNGNVDGTNKGGQMASYMWGLPTIQQLKDAGCHIYNAPNTDNDQEREINGQTPQFARVVVRMRYNISTTDYDPYRTDATFNQNLAQGVISPIQQNPTVDTGAHMQGLRLAINTAQTGRTFQDRSHVLTIMEQPAGNNPTTALQKQPGNLLNVNVRGKRGNIVQTYPAVEYDFEPNDFAMEEGQCVHFQWTGSNTHNNGNPAGDGQAGDAGEGKGGSDRSNIAELLSLRSSYPLPYDKFSTTFLDNSDCKWPLSNQVVPPTDAKIILASGGYYTAEEGSDHSIIDGGRQALNPLLDNASASFRQGLICCPKTTGIYNLVSTRNNNFSNRSQKMHIVVKPKTTGAASQASKWEFFPSAKTSTTDTKPVV